MVDKVHGTVFPAEHLTGNMDFFTVRTTLDIRHDTTNYDPTDPAQKRMDALVRIISTRAQPVIHGDVVVEADQTPPVPDLPAGGASGDPDVDVYVWRFAVEHTEVWDPEDLAVELDGVEGFVFSLGDTSSNNVIVYREDLLR
ncbi:MAG: hypothetical protein WC284_07790 [Candidimonas sp.]